MPHRVTAALILVVAMAGCRLERLPPPGSARDLEAIRTVVADVHRTLSEGDAEGFQALFDPGAQVWWDDRPPLTAAGFWQGVVAWPDSGGPRLVEAVPLRIEVRQGREVATTWAVSVWTVRQGAVTDTLEHRAAFLLRQRNDRWRILSLVVRRRPPAAGG